jgi:putative membrane-bound dehydrogenase-like protein
MFHSKRAYTILLCFVACITGFFIHAQSAENSAPEKPRRIEVLFLGSPNGSHRPLERFRTIRRAHGIKGINYTYANQPTALTKGNLEKYDALLVYGNHDVISKAQEEALLDYSNNGGACVFLHSACGCFRNSEPYIKLLGAQFKSHGRGVFRTKIVNPDHPVMKGFPGFECWDETYVHQKHNLDRVVLQKREEEPWTWVRTNGKGRIFYTASGHDERCWGLPEYQDLVYRGLMWTLNEKADLVKNLKLPKLEYYTSEVNILPRKSWGTPLDRKIPHTQFQKPLSVEDSLKLAQVPAGMELQLFASEPMVINPIAISWDNKGRMWVVEAYDYPNSFVMNTPGLDRIKILEDTDNDGKADKVSVFAEGLSIATTVLPIDGGCITTDNGEMIFLADTNADGKSDKRTKIFGGISLNDTHATVSNVRLGFDGWIYGTVGYSGIKTEVAGKKYNLRQGVFRFKKDGSAFEKIQSTTNNTWGLSFNEQGRILGSTANNNASFFVGMPFRHYGDAGAKPQRTPRADEQNFIYPNTFDYLQVDQKDRFTAAAGHTIYTARLFGKDWWNRRALICAPTGKLVSAPIVNRNGAGFRTTNTEQNIYASADSWSAPVAAEVGPEGAIYIADWYNSIVQHNVYGDNQKRGKGNAYISKHRDRKHGRIYRIMPKNATVKPFPKLETAKQQLEALSNDNLFWRLQAQHLLVKSGKENIPALQIIAASNVGDSNRAAETHAQYALAQLGEDVSSLYHSSADASIINNSKPTLENAKKWLSSMESYSSDQQLAVLLHACEVARNTEILKILKDKKVVLNEGLKKDEYLSHVMEIAILNHGKKADTVVVAKRNPLSTSAKRGKEVYKLTCVACHQPDGEGTPKVFPPLSGSDWLTRNPKHAIMVVTHGLTGPVTVSGKKYNGAMPAHTTLTNQQVMDVINYTRNAFEVQSGDIDIKLVEQIKAKYKNRQLPFTEKDIEAEKTAE